MLRICRFHRLTPMPNRDNLQGSRINSPFARPRLIPTLMVHAWATPERLIQAQNHYRHCQLCEHRCNVDRSVPHAGPCKAGIVPNVFRQRVEYGDERELAPSHLFYLSGCDLRCVFCINELNAFDPKRGQPLTADFFRTAVAAGLAQGPRTLQWVGGEPTIHLPAILNVMAECPALPRIVWKTDLHGTPEALALLDGVVAVYLADFKFGNDACARRLAKVDNYMAILTRNLRQVVGQGELIVRHLILPGHLDCCLRPIVAWLAEHLPRTKVSLRDGYLPHWEAGRYLELARPLAAQEGDAARTLAADAGLRLVA
jgi:putative pyruvate formate lyase activating enzyme